MGLLSLGGAVQGPPSVVTWGGALERDSMFVFTRGPARELQYWRCDHRLEWSGPHGLGGQLASYPAATSWGPGQLDVLAWDLNGNLLHWWYPESPGSASWSSPRTVIIGSRYPRRDPAGPPPIYTTPGILAGEAAESFNSPTLWALINLEASLQLLRFDEPFLRPRPRPPGTPAPALGIENAINAVGVAQRSEDVALRNHLVTDGRGALRTFAIAGYSIAESSREGRIWRLDRTGLSRARVASHIDPDLGFDPGFAIDGRADLAILRDVQNYELFVLDGMGRIGNFNYKGAREWRGEALIQMPTSKYPPAPVWIVRGVDLGLFYPDRSYGVLRGYHRVEGQWRPLAPDGRLSYGSVQGYVAAERFPPRGSVGSRIHVFAVGAPMTPQVGELLWTSYDGQRWYP
jgi:hypothetical protein